MRLKLPIFLGCLVIALAGWVLLNRMKRLGYLDSGIGTMRQLVDAENRFAQSHPDIGYTCVPSALPSDDVSAEVIETGRKNEYAFQINGCSAKYGQANTQYQITARPLLNGMPAFCSDQSGVLRYDVGGSVQKCVEERVLWP
jgi:hypothetical protein